MGKFVNLNLDETIKLYDNKKNGLLVALRYNEHIVKELINKTSFLDESTTISCRLYVYINNIKEKPICSCGKQLRFQKLDKGFFSTCGDKDCRSKALSNAAIKGNQSRDWVVSNEKTKQTCIERYGGYTSLCKDSSLYQMREQTMLERYNVLYALQNPELLNKQQKTTIERHGTLDIINLQQGIDTRISMYGSQYAMKNPIIANKTGNTIKLKKHEIIVNRIKELNYIIIDEIDDLFTLKCNICNNIFIIKRNCINYNYINNINSCHVCNPINYYRSKAEDEITTLIKQKYDGKIDTNKRYLERDIDIIIPDKKVCIEYNGIYWHSELHKSNIHHKDKKEHIKSKGYDLYYIWEDDWLLKEKRTIITHNIYRKLNIGLQINLNSTKIKELNYIDVEHFLKTNNLSGVFKSDIILGLFLNEQLIQVVGLNKNDTHYIMIYNCIKMGIITSGLNILLNYFDNKYKSDIYYNVNADWISIYDEEYINNGFILLNYNEPDYSYNINGNRINKKDYYDYLINLNKIEVKTINKKRYKVFDSGSLLFYRKCLYNN